MINAAKRHRLTVAGIGLALLYSTSAPANEAILSRAVASYNAMASKIRPLSFGATDTPLDTQVTRVPDWLATAKLTDREAAAAIAAFGVYGDEFQSNYRSRAYSKATNIAGSVADVMVNSSNIKSSDLANPETNQAPSRELTEWRRSQLIGAINGMRTCTGALVKATRKLAALRSGDDATRLLVKAQRDLGSAVMPPDDSCLR